MRWHWPRVWDEFYFLCKLVEGHLFLADYFDVFQQRLRQLEKLLSVPWVIKAQLCILRMNGPCWVFANHVMSDSTVCTRGRVPEHLSWASKEAGRRPNRKNSSLGIESSLFKKLLVLSYPVIEWHTSFVLVPPAKWMNQTHWVRITTVE